MLRESDLIVPAIRHLRKRGGWSHTGSLRKAVTSSVKLDIHDTDILPSGVSRRIDQKFRNLKCNGTLEEKLGLCVYFPGGFALTKLGWSITWPELRKLIKSLGRNQK